MEGRVGGKGREGKGREGFFVHGCFQTHVLLCTPPVCLLKAMTRFVVLLVLVTAFVSVVGVPVPSVVIPVRPSIYEGVTSSPLEISQSREGGVHLYLGYDITGLSAPLVFQASKADLKTHVLVEGCSDELQWHSVGAIRTAVFPNYLFFASSSCVPVDASTTKIDVSVLENTIEVPAASRKEGHREFMAPFHLTVNL